VLFLIDKNIINPIATIFIMKYIIFKSS